jgi:hypothetical protein
MMMILVDYDCRIYAVAPGDELHDCRIYAMASDASDELMM